jgi:hypothetical protein
MEVRKKKSQWLRWAELDTKMPECAMLIHAASLILLRIVGDECESLSMC